MKTIRVRIKSIEQLYEKLFSCLCVSYAKPLKSCPPKSFRSTQICISSLSWNPCNSQTSTFFFFFAFSFWVVSHIFACPLFPDFGFCLFLFSSHKKEMDFFPRIFTCLCSIPNILQEFPNAIGMESLKLLLGRVSVWSYSSSLICTQYFPMCQFPFFRFLLKQYFEWIVLVTCTFLVKCSSLFQVHFTCL